MSDHCVKGDECGILGNHTHPDELGVQPGLTLPNLSGVDQRIDEVFATLGPIVKKTKYIMPGWRIYLGMDNEAGHIPCLHIISWTPNSYNVEEMIGVNHSFLVPLAIYNERTWKAWIRDCIAKVWDHEIGEMLEFDGVKEFAPHHADEEDPYRVWHVGDLADTKVRAGEKKDG